MLAEDVVVPLRRDFSDTASMIRGILAEVNFILKDIQIDSDVVKTS